MRERKKESDLSRGVKVKESGRDQLSSQNCSSSSIKRKELGSFSDSSRKRAFASCFENGSPPPAFKI